MALRPLRPRGGPPSPAPPRPPPGRRDRAAPPAPRAPGEAQTRLSPRGEGDGGPSPSLVRRRGRAPPVRPADGAWGEAGGRLGADPIGGVVWAAAAGVHPDVMGIGPVPASQRALAKAGWSVDEVDLVEVNEAFAAQAVAVLDELKLDPDLVNVN